MARTQKDVVSYFPHDANACAGDTLTVLQNRFGNDGYAVWFKLLEKLAASDGHYLDCRNPMKWQLLVAYFGVEEITTVEILKLLVEIEAIDKDLWESKLIWCQKLVENIADVYRNRRREIPQKPIITDINNITTEDKGITTADNPQSKVKETKLNNTIDIDNILISGQSVAKIRRILAGDSESNVPEHIKQFWKRELKRLGIPVEETTQDKKEGES